jgi:hypothetical protein
MDIKQMQSLRRVFLLKLYETTGGDRWQNPPMFEIGRSIGIDDSLTRNIADYLDQKGFIKIQSKDLDVSITTQGIDEAESYYEGENTSITPDDIGEKLNEINDKLNLLSIGQEVIYEDIMDKLGKSDSIKKKDFILILISTIFKKGFDAFKISQILDMLK